MEYKRIFDLELEDLKRIILRMGEAVNDLIRISVRALKEGDRELAKSVLEKETSIDRFELVIDERCVELVALRQPEASDLRFLMTGISIATDLERIGDLAGDIAKRAIDISGKTADMPLDDIFSMSELAVEAVSQVLEAFIKRDPKKAIAVFATERKSDVLRDRVYDEVIKIMSRSPRSIPYSIALLFVSRHLERICDHTTNIAEDVVYMAEGKVLKHESAQKTRVLFVCIGNSARSQMAEAFTKDIAGDNFDIVSAGSKPALRVDPLAIEAMLEEGIDISSQKPKGYLNLQNRQFDYVITMGCGDACPIIPAREHIDWSIEDPKGKSLGDFRNARDVIKRKVKELLDKIL